MLLSVRLVWTWLQQTYFVFFFLFWRLLNVFFTGSPVKSAEIDFDLYSEKQLSETFKLYWRILKEQKELEAVLVVNGTSYAALGWRPLGLTKSCKNFPQLGPATSKTPKAEPEPKSEPEPEPEPTTTTEKPKKSTYSRRSAVVSTPTVFSDVDKVETSVSFQVSKKTGKLSY